MDENLTPLSFARQGDTVEVARVRGNEDLYRRLENLGFVSGAAVRIIADQGGNLIIAVKGTRVAVNRATAASILTRPSSGVRA